MFMPFKEMSQVHELSGWFGSIEKANGNTSCILHVYNVHHMVECRFCIKIDQNTVPNVHLGCLVICINCISHLNFDGHANIYRYIAMC
jgi:hypothetical protein